MKVKLAALSQLDRNTKLLIATTGMLSISFMGIQMLLKVLYVLRLDFGPEYVGWFLASSALAYMSMGLPSGALGARFGQRRIMIAGGLVSTLGMAILPLSEFMPSLLRPVWPILSQVLVTSGWSMFSVNMVPTLTAMTTEQNRTNAFSINAVVQGAGTFVGTLIGGLLPGIFARLLGETVDAPGPYRYALWVGATLSGLAILPLVSSKQIGSVATTTRKVRRSPFPLWPIATMFIYIYVRHAGWATGRAFWSPYMDEVLLQSTATIGLITSAGQALAIFAPLLNPWLAARRSNGWIAMMATLGVAVSLVPLALIPHWTAAGVSRLIFVIVSAVWLPAVQAFQMERIDPEWRSVGYGAMAMAMGSGFGSTSIVGGYVVAAAGYRTLFALGVVVSLIAAAIMWAILHGSARAAASESLPSTKEPIT